MEKKMIVEIWSDIACPFCYIGKQKFEQALQNFENRSNVEVHWKSYQLSPDIKTDPSKNINEFLAEHKGMNPAEAEKMNEYINEMAAKEGLHFNFETVVPANTMKAHQLIHFAQSKRKQNGAEEILFQSYFVDGKNIDDLDTLLSLGESIGLDRGELKASLENNRFADAVREDIYEAFQLGVKGVPFFVFNRKYGISGAQTNKVFEDTLATAYEGWQRENNPALLVLEGPSCDVNGNCS